VRAERPQEKPRPFNAHRRTAIDVHDGPFLLSYHLSSRGTFRGTWIPLVLAIATAVGVIASLALGRLYDRVGGPVLIAAVAIAALFSPLLFLGAIAAFRACHPARSHRHSPPAR
jgi:MFS family permease